MNYFLILAAITFVASLHLVYTRIHHARNARAWRCQPAPFYPSDLLGISTLREILHALKEYELPRLFQRRYERMCARAGRTVDTFCVTQLGRETVFTCDPKNVQAMLATQFKDFGVGPARQTSVELFLGHGIFTSDGDEWAHSRALLRPQFTRDQISDLDLEERHVQLAMRAIAPIDPHTRWSAPVNLQPIFFRLTIDSATEFLFGESVHSQTAALAGAGADAPDARFATLFDRCQWYAARRVRLERLHWLANTREFRDASAYVRAYVDRFVGAALTTTAGGDQEKGKTSVFLRGLAHATQDPVELRSQLLNILLAGRDTTASLLSFAVQQLARHPRVFAKLRRAVLDTFGPYDPSTAATITFETLKSCRYLQHFLNETLRVYPIVPVNRRVALRDTTLPRGGGDDGTAPVYVRRGQVVVYSVFVMQRRGDLWAGEYAAEEFVPERWETRRPGWEYLPFNGGPRICIGQQFALVEAAYVLVRLLQRYDGIDGVSPGTREGDPEREVKLASNLTMAPAVEVTVRLREA
ncbi:hypothetical protein HFD88_010054 [Aspergillus terreus]|nr:hypothetical protein HFD88_010054 [Aspergillus terreus]